MHHDRVDANLLQQCDIAAELMRQILLAHRMAAVFHHHGRAGVTAQERQGLRQNTGLFGRGGNVAGVSVCFAHRAALGRGGMRGQAHPPVRIPGYTVRHTPGRISIGKPGSYSGKARRRGGRKYAARKVPR